MTRKLTATEAKAKILAVLDEVAAGEEVEITKHGRTVARLFAMLWVDALIWCVAIIVVFAPLAVRKYRSATGH